MKITLSKKITIWFIVIILISLILYGALILGVYRYALRGENYLQSLKDSLRESEVVDQKFFERFREWERSKPPPLFPEITIITPGIFFRIGAIITGGVLIIIIISVAGGFLFLRRSLKQIDMITKNVKEIDDKRLHLRINMKGKDPISKMAITFDNMLDKIETSFKSQRQFIQNASHELNTPLTVIKTRIDALNQKDTITQKEYSKTLDLIDKEIMRLSKITEELLVLSELDENIEKDFKDLDLGIMIKGMIDLFENRIKSKNTKLSLEIKGRTNIYGDETKIEQLIYNLLDNAVKYCIPGTPISIDIYQDKEDKSSVITISNYTDKVDKEVVMNMFERFYKNKREETDRGFGLGLAIAKKIVQIHKGRLSAHFTEKDKKISFKVRLKAC